MEAYKYVFMAVLLVLVLFVCGYVYFTEGFDPKSKLFNKVVESLMKNGFHSKKMFFKTIYQRNRKSGIDILILCNQYQPEVLMYSALYSVGAQAKIHISATTHV
jgi:hypothetical protein